MWLSTPHLLKHEASDSAAGVVPTTIASRLRTIGACDRNRVYRRTTDRNGIDPITRSIRLISRAAENTVRD